MKTLIYASLEAEALFLLEEAESGFSLLFVGENHMSQSKLYCLHIEADSVQELTGHVETQLAKLKGGTPAAGKPAGKAPAAAVEAPAGPKATLTWVKDALTALKTAIDGDDAASKAGIKAVKAVLKKYGVTNSTDLTEDKYPAVLASIAEAMPKPADTDDDTNF